LKLLNDSRSESRFLDSLVNSFVEDNPSLRWCPAPGCQYAILLKEIASDHNEGVVCLCGMSFCFRCLEEAHQPASCSMVKAWKKLTNVQLDEYFVTSISRHCPHCKVPVEKNGGCNHMHCTKCSFHFCWLCMQKFGSGEMGSPDGYRSHKCNKFYEEDEKVISMKSESSRVQWYLDRLNKHNESRKQEQKLLENSDLFLSRIIDERGMSCESALHYVEALQQLLKNRQILKSSYIFGYFRPLMTSYVNKNIFEHLQQELERHTEMLSHLVGDSTSQPNMQSISNQMRVARKVMESLLSASTDWNHPIEEEKISEEQKNRRQELLSSSADDNYVISHVNTARPSKIARASKIFGGRFRMGKQRNKTQGIKEREEEDLPTTEGMATITARENPVPTRVEDTEEEQLAFAIRASLENDTVNEKEFAEEKNKNKKKEQDDEEDKYGQSERELALTIEASLQSAQYDEDALLQMVIQESLKGV